MRPTFMGFETATRGMMANQKSLDIVGQNLTNMGVTGYTRQRVDLVSLSVNMRYTRYSQNSSSFAGQGVGIYGVSQLRDKFLDKRFREEYSDVGYYQVTSSVLDDLTAVLDEIEPSTMSSAMQKFQGAWNDIMMKVTTESVGAANVRAEASKIVQVFRQMSSKIENVWNQQQYNLRLDVDSVNSIVERIAQLNDTISRERFNSMDVGNPNYRPLELLDQRNVLLDQLSEYGNFTYQEDMDGQVTVKMGGMVVVDKEKYELLSMRTSSVDDYNKTVSVFWNSSGEDVRLDTGSIRASLDMLNGRGLHGSTVNGETFNQGIPYYRDKIDEFARTFADAFNNVIEVADASGNAYVPPQYKTLFSFGSDSNFNAGNIRISDAWEAEATYIITDVLSKLDKGGKDENSYAAAAYNLFNSNLDFGEFQGGVFDYIRFYSNTKLNNDKSFADSRLEASSTITDNLLNQIQSVSGVSMEEEGVDMMQYKKAYDAVARVFTTLDEMLDKLINGTGVVGR